MPYRAVEEKNASTLTNPINEVLEPLHETLAEANGVAMSNINITETSDKCGHTEKISEFLLQDHELPNESLPVSVAKATFSPVGDTLPLREPLKPRKPDLCHNLMSGSQNIEKMKGRNERLCQLNSDDLADVHYVTAVQNRSPRRSVRLRLLNENIAPST